MEDWLAGHGQMVCLLLSWNCQAACRHCGYSCTPGKGPVISLEQGKHIIDCARQLQMTSAIAFAGGEPFLHYSLLLELSRYAKEKHGFALAVSTNGYWGTTRERAHEKLLPLVKSGLAAMLVSIDDFHLEFVNQQSIENCVQVAVELGVETHLQSIVTSTSRKAQDFRDMLNINGDSPLVVWHESPCSPAGRADELGITGELDFTWQSRPDSCSMLKTWTVNPYGDISPCCGVAFEGVHATGNAFRDSLVDTVNRANADPLLNALAAYGGPYLLIELLAKRGSTAYALRKYTGNCHACQSVLSDKKAMATIQGELQDHVFELIASRTIVHEQRWGNHAREGQESVWVPGLWFNRS
jgi:hypothetical protein